MDHLAPHVGNTPDALVFTGTTVLAEGVSLIMAAQAYRLLRAILMTAVKEDELIRVNPCRIVGAARSWACAPGQRGRA